MPFNNILEFVEGPTGLNQILLPVQSFILKLHYGIELDTHNTRIQIFDQFQERLRYNLSEADYLDYLFGEGRCSVSDQSSLPRPGLVLAAGRRTGKTTLAELIASYTVIQMLQAGNPHEVFGFTSVRPNLVAACYIGLNRNLVSQFLSRVSQNIEHCYDLREAVSRGSNAREIQFTTPEGKALNLNRGNLSILAVDSRPRIHASARAALIFDELAHMPNEQDTYNANIPTIRPPGRYVLMSTPRRAEGAFYNQFLHAMRGGKSAPLALQIPTWEVQPAIGPFLRQRFDENPTHFYVEYGAQWDHRISEGREIRTESIRV
jgi:hypothetical protein